MAIVTNMIYFREILVLVLYWSYSFTLSLHYISLVFSFLGLSQGKFTSEWLEVIPGILFTVVSLLSRIY